MGEKSKFFMTTELACFASAEPIPDAGAAATSITIAHALMRLRPECFVNMWVPSGFSLVAAISAERRVGQQSRTRKWEDVDARDAQHPWKLIRRDLERSRTGAVARSRLRIGGRACGMERDVAFHLLHDLVDVAVQHGDRSEPPQIGHGLIGIAGSPAPGLEDRPHRHMSKHDDRGARGAAPQILLEPGKLFVAEPA